MGHFLTQVERQIKIRSETFNAHQTVAETPGIMKVIVASWMAVAGIDLPGCATDQSGLALDTVGPVPAQTAAANPANGTLMVYSADDANADFNSRDPYRPEYSDFKIYAAADKLLQRVHNDSGTILQDPAFVELPTGRYPRRACANVDGRLRVFTQKINEN
jgi:hypothetical protein